MAAVAGATQRVKVGSAIAYAFMRSPILAANGAMDIDEISNGRTILGLGSGTKTMNEKWYSTAFDSPPAPRMQEAVELIRATFAAQNGGGLKFEGEHYNISIPQFVRPGAARESIPIYVAGVNIGMIRCAARVADGLVGHPVYTRGYIRNVVLPELEGSQCVLAPYVICAISEDVDQARNEARAQIAFYYSTPLYHSILDVHGWREQGAIITSAFREGDFKAMTEAVTDEMVDEIAITGTPAEVRDRMQQWQGLTESPLLYSPSIGMSPQRGNENLSLIAETFAS
jgi:probable F420-dependent oxidoreductase